MKINLERQLKGEAQLIKNLFMKAGWKELDEMAIQKDILGHKLYIVIYPKLLSFGYLYREGNDEKKRFEEYTTPWIACRVGLENDINHLDILKELKKDIDENIQLKPFKDEDATCGMFGKYKSPYDNKDEHGTMDYVCYFNIDFPNGWWENHTL